MRDLVAVLGLHLPVEGGFSFVRLLR